MATYGPFLRHKILVYQVDDLNVTCRQARWYVESKRIRNAKVVGSIPASGNSFLDIYV